MAKIAQDKCIISIKFLLEKIPTKSNLSFVNYEYSDI